MHPKQFAAGDGLTRRDSFREKELPAPHHAVQVASSGATTGAMKAHVTIFGKNRRYGVFSAGRDAAAQ
jgi:hypothetical protein